MPDGSAIALDDILGLRLRLAHGAVQRHFTEHFADLGLTQKQVSVLWSIGDRPGTAQADVALALQMDRATTMALVHALEKRGLVERKRSDSDARRIGFALTPAGAAKLVDARAAIAAHERWLRARFSPQETATLMTLLDRIRTD